MAVDETIVNGMKDPTKGRASGNENDQHPVAERPKWAITRG